jgi:hypothetical protein
MLVAADPKTPAQKPVAAKLTRELQVGVTHMPPFTMKGTNGIWEGLSVELWKHTAASLGWSFRLHEFQAADLLGAVATGRVDVALSPFPISLENEELVDFTHSYYSTGLSIAVPHREVNPWKTLALELVSPRVLGWTLGLLVCLVLVGVAIWLAERKTNHSEFETEANPGIGSGIWWAAVTLTTVGYGDKVPRTGPGRLLATLWLFLGIFLLAAFTGHISSTLTLQHLSSPIQSPQDLPKYRIAAVIQSGGADYLLRHHIRSKLVPDEAAALDAVQRGEAVAFISATPSLRYQLRKERVGRFDILPFTLDRRDYAFPLPNGSPLRESLNRQVLRSLSTAEWRELLFEYLEE